MLVSICIPSYKPRHFEYCLASAFAQTYPKTEIIVSDQCPTEAIRDICAKYGDRVRYHRNALQGAQQNLLTATDLAQGEYIKFLFDDDLLHPDCVTSMVDAFERTSHLNTRLAFSPRRLIDGNNKVLGDLNQLGLKDQVQVLRGSEVIRMMMATAQNFIGEFTTTMFRKKDAYDASGRNVFFDFGGKRHTGLGDVSAWLHFASLGDVVALPEVLSYFRMHNESNSNVGVNPEFIHGVTDWQVLQELAAEKGYMDAESIAMGQRALLGHYRKWLNDFPELSSKIRNVEMLLERKSA